MTPQERLAAAIDARHRIMVGDHAVEVDTGTHKTVFGKPNLAQLDAYIAQLQAEIAGRPVRGAIGIVL